MYSTANTENICFFYFSTTIYLKAKTILTFFNKKIS